MIKKELYMTREDGMRLFRTFSDTDHKIRNKRTSEVYTDAVDISENEEYEEVEDYIELEGPSTYEEILKESENAKLITRKINCIGLTNNEALSVKHLYPQWNSKIGKTIEQGFIVFHNENLWKCRQTHTALENYSPSMNTASLWEVIVEEHSGTIDDAIPYTPPMEIFKDKYYSEGGIVYKCTRDSLVALTHNLGNLVGIYVEIVNN
jgi:hypothetical protein